MNRPTYTFHEYLVLIRLVDEMIGMKYLHDLINADRHHFTVQEQNDLDVYYTFKLNRIDNERAAGD